MCAILAPLVAIQSLLGGALHYGAEMSYCVTLHYAPDNASLCVRLALELSGMPYKALLVDRSISAQRDHTYLAMNPNGLIPVLETEDGPIYETAAILLWLADQVPGEMFPRIDDADRGKQLSILFWLSNTLHTNLRMLFYPAMYYPTDPDEFRAAARLRTIKLLDMFENDKWLDAPDHGILACYLGPILRWPALYGGDTGWYDLRRWPRLHAFTQQFERIEEVKIATEKEGLGPTPFSAPHLPNPPEGTAT